MQFTKVHATGNDFVLVADPAGSQQLDAELVAALCDRHRGIGADGLIRAVPAHLFDAGRAELAATGLTSTDQAPLWFMDYRNSDGSVSEMCGNGVRAFAHYLRAQGLASFAEDTLPVLTRGGLKTVRQSEEGYAVSMGVWSFIDPELASERASDSLVRAAGLSEPRPALSISMGNPHTVVALSEPAALQNLDLHRAPTVDPTPPNGTNVEFVVPAEPLVEAGVGRVRMRVHERGVGETLSCGTGACAAAAAVRVWAAGDGVDTWRVSVPGGKVTVRFSQRSDGAEEVELSGPATLVYTGELTAEYLPQ
ncbi:diaminopimelate epimerase [Nesterenkonia sp.]|uniref:diaminopimelate epimerase n=1 Tax=Nesterenkonia sp. TaxID=704201 RepID=UPI00262C5677|nr:diaminopimelate epimerase [Nesterenkonia sp.]